jgi:hypothetical protein
MIRLLLVFFVLALGGCATNPGIDHRIVCSLDGHAAFATTYGPLAFFNLAPDADVICGTVHSTPAVTVTAPVIAPAPIAASGVKP